MKYLVTGQLDKYKTNLKDCKMELNQTTFKDAIFGAESEMSFSIDDNNSIIFDILRDKMYSNKIGSLCREVASNSRDANREAGRNDTAIEIEIVKPDKLAFVSGMCIVFRDYGLGITPDRMSNVFVKYASSTKRSTNSQTGGFGLGAKTPFAYTDTFSVVTVCDVDGKRNKYIYTAMIDSSRKGKMILFDVEEGVDESTGTQIVVPIKERDRDRFEQECLYSTCLWTVQPELINFNQQKYEINRVIDEETFSIIKDQSNALGNSSYLADIDGICYKVDKSALGIADSGILGEYTIVGKFNVGQLTISANREALQYDESTIEKMNAVFNDVKQYLQKQGSQLIDDSKTYIEACYRMSSMSGKSDSASEIENIIRLSISTNGWGNDAILDREAIKGIEWKGKKLVTKIEMSHHTAFSVSKTHDGKVDYVPFNNNTITNTWINSPIYYLDTRKNVRRNITIWDECTSKYPHFILLIASSKSTQNQVIDECIKLGFDYDMDIKMYSDVKRAENNNLTGSTYTPSETVTIKVRRRNNFGWSSDSLELHRESKKFWNTTSDSEDSNKYAYTIVESLTDLNDNPYGGGISLDKIDLIKKLKGRTVVAINQRTYNRYVKDIVDFPEANQLADRLIEQNKKQLTEAKIVGKLNEHLKNIAQPIKDNIPQIFPQILQKAIENERKINETEGASNTPKLPILDSIDVKFDFNGLDRKIEKCYNKYPMLESYIDQNITHYSWRYSTKEEKDRKIKIITDYIKLVG